MTMDLKNGRLISHLDFIGCESTKNCDACKWNGIEGSALYLSERTIGKRPFSVKEIRIFFNIFLQGRDLILAGGADVEDHLRSMRSRSRSAGPLGFFSPCSHCCTVVLPMPRIVTIPPPLVAGVVVMSGLEEECKKIRSQSLHITQAKQLR